MQDAQARYEESLDIKDPGARSTTPAAERQSEPAQQTHPTGIPGAKADGGLTESLVARAAQFDIDREDLAGMKPQAVERMVSRLERQAEYEPEPEQHPFAFDPYTGKPLTPQQHEEEDIRYAANLKNEDGTPVEFDDNLVKFLKQQRKELAELKKVTAEQQKAIQFHQQQAQARQNQEDFRALEKCFADDKDYHHVFGEGDAESLVGTSSHRERAEVGTMCDAIRLARHQQGLRPLPMKQLYVAARNAVLRERLQEGKPAQQTIQAYRNRAGQFIAPPTATTREDRSNLSPTEKAVSAVAAAMRNGHN